MLHEDTEFDKQGFGVRPGFQSRPAAHLLGTSLDLCELSLPPVKRGQS